MTENERGREFEMQGASFEAAVQAVLAEPVPSDAVARVKARAKALAGDDAVTVAEPRGPRAGRASRGRWRSWSLLAASLAAVLVLMLTLSRDSSLAWAEMLDAVRRCAWVHGTTTYSQDGQIASSEFWFSNADRVAAMRFGQLAQFDDVDKDITLKYSAKDDIIDRLPALKVRQESPGEFEPAVFLDRLFDRPSDARDMFRGEQIVKAERERVEKGGHKTIQYLLHLQKIDNPSQQRTVRVRLNAESQLPEVWEERHANGMTSVTRFDYPASGPKDIYDLGVPNSAKLVDHVPRGELARIERTNKADRRKFDDYDAIVVESAEDTQGSVDDSLQNLRAKRVRRTGDRYRIDQLLVPKEELTAPTKHTDMQAWWHDNRNQFWSVPELICDGQRTYQYQMLDDRLKPGQKPNLSLVLTTERAVGLPADDPAVEWPNLMPEQWSRPHLWTSDVSRTFEVSPDANDGPAGAVRVAVDGKKGAWHGELFRYWFEPGREFVLLKSVAPVFRKGSDEVAYVGTDEFGDFTRSPRGMWFPQEVRSTTTDAASGGTRITRFYVDFDVELPAELFEAARDN